jgi:hypothetical protein
MYRSLTSALARDEWLALLPSRFTLRGRAPEPIPQEAVWTPEASGQHREVEILDPTETEATVTLA